MARDLYSVLGVSKDVDEDAIKKAFRKLAMKYHPDKNPGKAAEQRFKDVNQAYEVLGDKEKRSLYDEFGDVALSQNFDAERARAAREYSQRATGSGFGGRSGFDVQEIFGGGDFGDALGDLFGRARGSGRASRRAARGQDVEHEIAIDFVAAVKGTSLTIAAGPGQEPVTVRIPPGANEGSRLRISGRGSSGAGGGPPGDLFLRIHVSPHPLFRREGDDLHLDVPVTIGEAYMGAKIRIPTPDGDVSLKVPQRTQSGIITRLRGKGVARKTKEPGDLYVKFVVMIPTKDDPEIAKDIEALERFSEDPRRELHF